MSAKFSDRLGYTEPRKTIQVDSIDDALRNSIWNLFCIHFDADPNARWGLANNWTMLVSSVAVNLAKVPLNSVPSDGPDSRAKDWIFSCYFEFAGSSEWYEIYNLLEFTVQRAEKLLPGRRTFLKDANTVLENELSGFRFTQTGALVPIANEVEVKAIDEAITAAGETGLDGVRTHLVSALEKLAQKPEPDYRNSIKESISAVEAAAKAVSGASDFKSALKKLASEATIHPAMQQGFLKLYGYTSDGDGIRHAIEGNPSVGLTEAKYMLVTCSAFAHYLMSKAQEAGLL